MSVSRQVNLFLAFLVIFEINFQSVAASGFMKWSRPMPPVAPSTSNIIASASGVSVISRQLGNLAAITDIVNTTTGMVIVSINQSSYYDTSVILTPSNVNGSSVNCHLNGGVLSPWCGVLQISSTSMELGAHIILPNAAVIPLVQDGSILPWNCTNALPCTVRSQELRSGQSGGCHRSLGFPSVGQQSTHVTLFWNGALFMFRPSVVATASHPLEHIMSIIAPQSANSLDLNHDHRIDSIVQYTSIGLVESVGLSISTSATVCGLALMYANGTVMIYNSDAESERNGVGLQGFSSVSLPTGVKYCVPSIETVVRTHPNPTVANQTTQSALCSTTLIVMCSVTSNGYLFNFDTENLNIHQQPIVSATANLVGQFSIPRAFNWTSPSPLRTDSTITLVQPTIGTPSNNTQLYFSPLYSYVTAVAISRPTRNAGVPVEVPKEPLAALITFTSSVLSIPSLSSSSSSSLWLTQHLVRNITIGDLTSTTNNVMGQNATNIIGWAAAASLPASITIATNSTELLTEAISLMTRWTATDGVVLSVITENFMVLVSPYTGNIVTPTPFSMNPNDGSASGGIKTAPIAQIDGYSYSLALSPMPSGLATSANSNLSQQSANILLAVADHSNSNPTDCVYTLRAPIGYITGAVMVEAGYNDLPVQWVDNLTNYALFASYTESYCVDALSGLGGGVSIVPAADSMLLVQSSVLKFLLSAIPLADAITATYAASYEGLASLTANITDVLPPVVTSLDGFPFKLVCAGDTLFAYESVIGNTSWSLWLGDVPACQVNFITCLCPTDSRDILITSNHKFVVMYARAIQESNENVQSIVALEALTGSLIYDFQPVDIQPLESLCTLIPAPVVNFSYVTEIRSLLPAGSTFDWWGVATIPGTRCLIMMIILYQSAAAYHETVFPFKSKAKPQEVNTTGHQRRQQRLLSDQGNYGLATAGIVLDGAWASYTGEIALFGDSILLFDASQGNAPGSTMSGFPISKLAENFEENFGGVLTIFPTFSAKNVISSATIGARWTAAQVVYTDARNLELHLFAYELGTNFNPVTDVTVANYKTNDPNLNEKLARVSVFSLPRPLVPMVCVVASNLTCFSANALQYQIPPALSTPLGFYDLPQLGVGGIMMFAHDGYPCQAIIFSESELAPRVLWDKLVWVGMADGIDMNVNSSSCENAILTNEALVMLCSPIGSSYKHTYVVEAFTGRVILAQGPRALLGSVVIASSGESVSYATAFNTAITILFAGSSTVSPITMESSFCIVDSTSINPTNYYLRFSTSEQTITATRAPWSYAEANQQITISMSNSSVFPLTAKQFKGPSGILMGSTFELENSGEILAVLRSVLPAVLAGTLNFIRGPVMSLTTQDYSMLLSTSQSCQVCDYTSCPQLCTVEIATGDQLLYSFNFNSLQVSRKPCGDFFFGPPNETIMIPFFGNASLTANKLAYDLSATMQTLDCTTTIAAQTSQLSSGRFCMAVPVSSGKQYVSVEIGPSGAFATVTSFYLSWGATYYVSKETFQGSQVWSVRVTLTLADLINSSLGISFPDSLPNGIKVYAVADVTEDSQDVSPTPTMLAVFPITDASTNDFFQLSAEYCVELDAEIPLCPTTLADTSSLIDSDLRTIVWRGQAGNWGDGFVASGTSINLLAIMRNPSVGDPAHCGGSDNVCPTQCQPTANCFAQLNSYFYNYLYAVAMLPQGSSAPVPNILQASCEGILNVSKIESMPLQVTLFCTSEGNVVISSSFQASQGVLGTTIESNNTLGAQFSCSRCTYFMYVGILSQPFEWIAAGAVKNLVVTTLVYVLLEKIRANHRLQTRTKSRLRHHHERLRLLEGRLDAHRSTVCASADAISLSNQALDTMSEQVRRDEFHLLTNEIHRVNTQIQEDKIGIAAMESKRWTCTRWLPNPITVYSNLVLSLSGIRNPSERRSLLVRVQDGLSSKHVTEQQLVDMLLRITGGSTTAERHAIEAFSSYYQWNMCLNRQVVVRDYIDESAHAGAPGIKEAVDHSLTKIHQKLLEVYVLFRISSQGTGDTDCVSLPQSGSEHLSSTANSDEPLIATERLLAPPAMDHPVTSDVLQAKLREMEGAFSKSMREDFQNDCIPHATINAPFQHETALPLESAAISDKCQPGSNWEQYRHRASAEMLNKEVKAFVELIHVHPQCFEYASLPSRSVDDSLTPSTIILLLSLLQCAVSITVYAAEILEKKGNRLQGYITSFDAYQTIFFMAFNSSTPSSLLVSAIARADLSTISSPQCLSSKLKEILADPYVVSILALFSAPFATHVIPGAVLYGWLLLPPLAAVLFLEYTLRKRYSHQTLVAIVARFVSRVLILFVAALVCNLSYNYSAIYIYSSPDGYMMSGSYRKAGYLQAVRDDFKARDLECYYAHITTTMSNFLQMGFTSAY